MTHRSGVDAVAGRELAEPGGETARAVAFTRLADEHLDASYRLAHAIMGSRAEAEDATHDALIQAWRHWSQLRDQRLFEHWFHRILVNTCRSRLRRTSRWATQDLSPELAVVDGDPIGLLNDREQIRSGLARLSPDHRAVLALRYYLDLSIGEIAARLGISQGTVNSRLHYALRHMRTVLTHADSPGVHR